MEQVKNNMYRSGIGIEEREMTLECLKKSRGAGEGPELAYGGYFALDLHFRINSLWLCRNRLGHPKIDSYEPWFITNGLFCDHRMISIIRIWWISVAKSFVVDWLFIFGLRESGSFRGQATIDEDHGSEIVAMFRAFQKTYFDMDWIPLQIPS
jgi:hypothetical protein